MSVSHKKINGLIEKVIEEKEELNYDKDKFIQLCQRIYLIESSVDDRSRSQTISDIRDEIIRRSTSLLQE
ncbi:hypothetical protein [Marinobacter lipolyticus]|uniref:hypothetical protein n=1 Tax=Marinobacter lipolyticus TaxID=209639 RepID=UPI003A901F9F